LNAQKNNQKARAYEAPSRGEEEDRQSSAAKPSHIYEAALGGPLIVRLIRALFVVACIIMGVLWAHYILSSYNETAATPLNALPWQILGGLAGCIAALLVLFLLQFINQELFERLSPAMVAIVLAMVMGYFIGRYIVHWIPGADPTLQVFIITTLVLLFGFAGIFLGLTRASNWESLIKAVRHRNFEHRAPKLVDTSVIIDGRITDICQTGFIEGTLLIPRFVLKELQSIADSSDVLRRARGRRGLDIVRQLQDGQMPAAVEVIDDDPTDVQEVDGKLVRLARELGASIVTNDLNLNKVAQIEGVTVLNINDLANALKPAVLPDEHMEVKIVKEGKEALQGVGYLDDGTMVVVDGGKSYVGRDVSVVVTSVLQTTAGRMIFTKLEGILS